MTPFAQKVLIGVLTGAGSAAVTDLHAALTLWRNWEDFRNYSWGVATFRWVQGAFTGGAMAAGLGGLI